MFQRLMLRLMGQEEKPPDPFEGEVRGIAYHVDSLPKGFVSIWIDLPRDRMQIEPQRRKRLDEHANKEAIDHYTQPIWNCGAQTIDIGFSDDKIEAVIPAYMKKVDRKIAEFIVGLMVSIRHEALGEREPVKMPRPWSKAAEGMLDLDGQCIQFEFSACVIYTEEAPDVFVRTQPQLSEEELEENLRLALPGFDALVESDCCVEFDDGDGIVAVNFGLANSSIGFGDDVREAIKSLREVEVFWGDGRERKLATLPCDHSLIGTSP